MTQTSYPWGGITVGDAVLAPYDDDEWSDIWAARYTKDRTVQGVYHSDHPSYNGDLAITNPAGTTIRVATGIALVDGKMYFNDANVDFSVTAPGAGSNYYTVVIRKSFAAQTVRLALVGPDAAAPPAVTQTDSVTWEISIATVQITSASAITITDARRWVVEIATEDILDDAVTTAKILDENVTAAKIANRTRTVFIPAMFSSASAVTQGYGGVLIDATGTVVSGRGLWQVPTDFASGLTIKPVIWLFALGAGDLYLYGFCEYEAVGEAQGTHNDNKAYAAYTGVADSMWVPFTHTLASAAVGDIVHLYVSRDEASGSDTWSTQAWLSGWIAEYTADS